MRAGSAVTFTAEVAERKEDGVRRLVSLRQTSRYAPWIDQCGLARDDEVEELNNVCIC